MIYVASSWRNVYYPVVLEALALAGVHAYDWRDSAGFHWSDVFGKEHPAYIEHWTDPIPAVEFKKALADPRAEAGFDRDMDHLRDAEAVLVVLPCGKSAHLEAGWALGAGMPAALFAPEDLQPELMYGMFDAIHTDLVAAVDWAFENTRGRIPS